MLQPLISLLGPGYTIDNPADMVPYLTSWRGQWQGKAALIAFPDSTGKVSALVKYCAEHNIPMVPQGGNTGLVGGSVPDEKGNAVVINLSRMNHIRTLDAEGFTLTAEAGCILATLQEKAAEHDRLFPLSMASEGSAQVGGFVSTNAGGTAVLRYGTTRDLVLGLEAVLPNGEILHGLNQLRKNNTGYDLKQLFIGAEGTLGIVTAVTFKLFPKPKMTETALLGIPTVEAAVALLGHFRTQTGDALTAFELMSREALALVTTHFPDTRLPFPAPYYILAEVAGGDNLRPALEQALIHPMESGLLIDGTIAESLTQRQAFWFLREHISEAVRKSGMGIHFDIALPIHQIADFMTSTDARIDNAIPGIKRIAFGHVGDGNVHYNMYLPFNTSGFAAHKETLKTIVYEELRTRNGSISAEHGIGQERKEDLLTVKSAVEIALMRTIKSALDPQGLMNPGVLLA